jgi:16S rRNA G966 N2-methylase RsmD
MKRPAFIETEALKIFLELKGIRVNEALIEGLVADFNTILETKVRQEKNKSRIVRNDASKDSVPARSILTKEQINSLPAWVRKQVDSAAVVGSSRQVIQVSDGRKYHLGNPLNDLSGGEWTFFLNSVISTRYSTSGPESYAHHIRKVHPSPKPPQLMRQIIEFFTKENEIVFDYFMGVGGTLLGASLSNRRAIGVDLSQQYIDVYKQANAALNLREQRTINADSIKLLEMPEQLLTALNGEKFSLIAIDPPYGDMMNREKTGESAKRKLDTAPTPFTNLSEDLGNFQIEQFYPVFKNSVAGALSHLKTMGHVVVFIKDLQPDKSNTNLLHARVIEDLNSIPGLQYLGTKIWADQSVNLYPYGYPYAYVANQIHQYIMIFRKVS